MFDELDKITWENIEIHIAVGTSGGDIPAYIRELVSDNETGRLRAIDALMGGGQHTGMVGAATPYILPFVYEVLAVDDYPETALLLHKLEALGNHIINQTKNIVFMKRAIKVYDVLVTGLELFIRLLNNSNAETRFYAAKLLCYFQEQGSDVLNALMQRFGTETEVRIRVAILRSMARLMIDGYLMYGENYRIYTDFIASQITEGKEIAERFAAADSIREMRPGRIANLENRIQTVIREFTSGRSDFDDSGDPQYFYPVDL